MSATDTALLVMDMQQGITQYFPASLIDTFAQTIDAARRAGVPVVYVTVRWRPTRAEVNERNKYVANVSGSGWFFEGAPSADIDARLAPLEGETVVVKRRVGAFSGSDLDLVLRKEG